MKHIIYINCITNKYHSYLDISKHSILSLEKTVLHFSTIIILSIYLNAIIYNKKNLTYIILYQYRVLKWLC